MECIVQRDDEDERVRLRDCGRISISISISSPNCCSCLYDELVLEILVRVHSLKSIFRCKCVCKRWYHLINPNPDPYFLRRLNDPPPTFYLLNMFAHHHPFQVTPLKKHIEWFRMRPSDGFSLSFLPIPNPDLIHILDSSKGLILCSPARHDHSAYFICNPVTRLWLPLPPPPLCRAIAASFPDPEHFKGLVLAALAFEPNGARFRVVCLPAATASPEFTLEVFASETGRWATCNVQRPNSHVPASLSHVVVCDHGRTVFWLTSRTFVAFHPWDGDGSFSFYPLPPHATASADVVMYGQTRGSLRIMTRHNLVRDVGPAYTVYVLQNGVWLQERVIHLRRLATKSNWLSRYARKRDSLGSGCLAFHPDNADMLYLRCKDYVVQVDTRRSEWRVIDVVHESKVYHHHAVPLMLPWWPTPIPQPTTTAAAAAPDRNTRSSTPASRKIGWEG